MSERPSHRAIRITAIVILYVTATSEGSIDFEETKKLLAEIGAMPAPAVNYAIIVDIRSARSVMSVADQYYLTEVLFEYRESFSHKVAILCAKERIDHKGFFGLCARNRGFKVHAFT